MEQTSGPRFNRSGIALLTGLAVDNFGAGLFLPLALVYATRVVGLEIGIAGPAVGLPDERNRSVAVAIGADVEAAH